MNKQTGSKKLGQRYVGGFQVRTVGMIFATAKNGVIRTASVIGQSDRSESYNFGDQRRTCTQNLSKNFQKLETNPPVRVLNVTLISLEAVLAWQFDPFHLDFSFQE
jgi:hypothetical protein